MALAPPPQKTFLYWQHSTLFIKYAQDPLAAPGCVSQALEALASAIGLIVPFLLEKPYG